MIEPTGPEEILSWYGKFSKEINEIDRLLAIPMTNEIGFLQNHISDLASKQGTLSRLFADAQSLLEFSEQQQLLKRNPDWTDLDRSKMLTAATRNERRIRNILGGVRGDGGFTKALQNNLMAAMSMKKSLSGEVYDHGEP